MSFIKVLMIISMLALSIGCSQKKETGNSHEIQALKLNQQFFNKVGSVYPYNSKSNYSKQIQKCIYAREKENSCTFSELPLIGMEKKEITIDLILNRTLISHDYLGFTFKEILKRMPQETLQLFGAVNAIVISDKINPSFYTSSTGAIYLSGRYFWTNQEEKMQMTTVKDYRSGFSSALSFADYNGYIKNKEPIDEIDHLKTRTYDEIFFPIARLLFHELAHANDYFPSSFYLDEASLDQKQTYKEVGTYRYINYKIVSDSFPTNVASQVLKKLGKVMYDGETPTKEEKELTAFDIKNEFLNDVASDMYAYSDPMEDLAMVFEESLSLYYFDAYRYFLLISYPHSDFVVPKDYEYPIVWGEIGRVLRPEIQSRATFSVDKILGNEISSKVKNKLNNLYPIEIPQDTAWDDIYKF